MNQRKSDFANWLITVRLAWFNPNSYRYGHLINAEQQCYNGDI